MECKELASFFVIACPNVPFDCPPSCFNVWEGTTHCDIRGVKPSPDHTRLVYSADFSGNETYEIVVLDIATGEKLESDPVDGVAGTVGALNACVSAHLLRCLCSCG